MITIPDETNETGEPEESLIDDVLVEGAIEETNEIQVEEMPEETFEEPVEEIIVPLDEEELIPIGEEPIVPTETDLDEFEGDIEEDVTASGMNQEATMRIHQLMRATGQAVGNQGSRNSRNRCRQHPSFARCWRNQGHV